MKKHHIAIGIGGFILGALAFIILPTADIFDIFIGALMIKFFGIYAYIYFLIITLFIATLVWYYKKK